MSLSPAAKAAIQRRLEQVAADRAKQMPTRDVSNKAEPVSNRHKPGYKRAYMREWMRSKRAATKP